MCRSYRSFLRPDFTPDYLIVGEGVLTPALLFVIRRDLLLKHGAKRELQFMDALGNTTTSTIRIHTITFTMSTHTVLTLGVVRLRSGEQRNHQDNRGDITVCRIHT